MGNDIRYLKTKNETFPFTYSLNVMEALQNEFGSLNEWSDMVEPKDGSEPKIKALLFFFKEAINEGIDIENENSDQPRKFVNERKVGRIITELGVKTVLEQLKGTVIDAGSNNDTEVDETKNVITTQNQ